MQCSRLDADVLRPPDDPGDLMPSKRALKRQIRELELCVENAQAVAEDWRRAYSEEYDRRTAHFRVQTSFGGTVSIPVGPLWATTTSVPSLRS